MAYVESFIYDYQGKQRKLGIHSQVAKYNYETAQLFVID